MSICGDKTNIYKILMDLLHFIKTVKLLTSVNCNVVEAVVPRMARLCWAKIVSFAWLFRVRSIGSFV